ncbi:kinase-like protein [Gonapodya prolifera JEL478]|uniref:Kinase-like protein n=1 Tax=Gonapodya prolifera (strain JEL478) TaxID=1344416 RepID=A0A139AR57_GONPJ|nr:kinase-like protein [Gonapodya prolifera JEL478]|eukprot:KXS19209.1 kinase-like protein [Gonapodya prolifera JEL478]
MELCEQGSLQDFLEDFATNAALIDEYRVWQFLADIALALSHVHNLNIIHLDVKPANLLIAKDFRLKLGDFGLATYWPVPLDTEREGDRNYIAPEILLASYGKPADIFSFGLVVLELTANVVLPEFGSDWHRLRSGDLSICDLSRASQPLRDLIRSMLDPDATKRPTADQILAHPLVATLIDNPETDRGEKISMLTETPIPLSVLAFPRKQSVAEMEF